MPRVIRFLIAVFAVLSILSPAAMAQEAPKEKPAPLEKALDQAVKEDAKASALPPVSVEHNDADAVGVRLAYQVKELVGRSSLMRMSTKDEKKVVLLLTTAEEFTGRPAVSSVYSAIWLYSAKAGSLRYYLTSQTGIADAASLGQTVEAIMAQTSKVCETYSYLFQ